MLCTGFERTEDQSVLDFALDIATDQGKMGLVGGKRANALSLEDLADLNRSIANIKAGSEFDHAGAGPYEEGGVFSHADSDEDDDSFTGREAKAAARGTRGAFIGGGGWYRTHKRQPILGASIGAAAAAAEPPQLAATSTSRSGALDPHQAPSLTEFTARSRSAAGGSRAKAKLLLPAVCSDETPQQSAVWIALVLIRRELRLMLANVSPQYVRFDE